MKTANREEMGSGGSATGTKIIRYEALGQSNIRSGLMQGYCRFNSVKISGRFTTIKVQPDSLHFKSKDRSGLGQSLVEFALVLPILVLIIYGIFDLGRAFYALVTISNASREGARYMTQHVTVMDSSVNNSRQLVREHVKREALGSGIVLTDAAIIVDCVRALDSTNKPTPNCAHGQDAWVRVNYTFVPLFSVIIPTSLPLKWETRMLVP